VYLPAPDEAIWIGVLRLGVHVPGSRSRKDRRKVVAGLRDHLRARHNLSVAEVGHLESRDRAVLAAVLVANDQKVIRSQLDAIAHTVEARIGGMLASRHVEIFPANQESPFSGEPDWL
jgi:hypothetical protein